MKIFYIIFLVVSLFVSCENNSKNTIEVSDKYREKNLIKSIEIEGNNGTIDIEGWSQNFIEIDTRKVLYSGLNNDLSFMTTDISQKDSKLTIKTKIPPSIDGKIELKIYIPYNLSFIFINSTNGKVSINGFLGDLDIINVKSDVDINFYGTILRVDSYSSNINLNMKNAVKIDAIIKNSNGLLNLYLDSVESASYIDLDMSGAKTNFYMNNTIPHEVQLVNIGGTYDFTYKMDNQKIIHSQYTLFSAAYGKSRDLNVYVTNNKSEIRFIHF